MASTYCSVHVHLIFATKNRAPMMEERWRARMHAYLAGTAKRLGAVPIAVGGVEDHVHLALSLRPTHRVAEVVQKLKQSSSLWAKGHFHAFAWQEGYAVISEGAARLPALKNYIAGQEEHHRKLSSRDELLKLCREACIDVDMAFFE